MKGELYIAYPMANRGATWQLGSSTGPWGAGMIGVTFYIKYDDTYSERYNRLHEAMKKFGVVEDRSTSCLFLNTDDSAAVDLALYGALDYKKDKAIVFTTFASTFKFFGPK